MTEVRKLALNAESLQRSKERLRARTNGEALSAAVESFLTPLAAGLAGLGLSRQEVDSVRPRRIDAETWGRLVEAAETLDSSAITLLRASLLLASQLGRADLVQADRLAKAVKLQLDETKSKATQWVALTKVIASIW